MEGQSIKALRWRYRLTQRQLAEQLGVTSTTVYRWEKGLSKMSESSKYRTAEIFGKEWEKFNV